MSIKTVGVRFAGGVQDYYYLTDLDVVVGKKVIVESPRDGYVTVMVTTVKDGSSPKATKYLVNIIDDSAYLERAANEKLRQQIVEKLEKKKKEVEQMAIYSYLAENDSEAALLFAQLKQLSK